MTPFMNFVVGSAFVVILIGLILVAVRHKKKVIKNWAQAARTLRLDYPTPGLFKNQEMSGSIGRFFVRADTYVVSSGKSSQTYTRFRVQFPQSLQLQLKLSKQGFFNAVFRFFGSQDVEVGDPRFDDGVVVKGSDPEQIRKFLTPARRARIQRLFSSCSSAEIEDTEVRWVKRGMMHEPSKLVSTVHSLLRVSSSLCFERPEDASLTRAMGALGVGDVDQALATVVLTTESARSPLSTENDAEQEELQAHDGGQDEVAGSPQQDLEMPQQQAPVEEQVLAGELLYLGGKRDEAREAFEVARTMAPDDPEISDWVERASQPEPALPVPDDGPTGAIELDQHRICDELFQPGVNSFQITNRFERSFQGRAVRWNGCLVRVESFRFDLVFGNSPGVKAIVEIHESELVTYGDQKIMAVVQLPENEYGPLRELVKQEIVFEGLLLKVDGFMRNIYVSSGTLLGADTAK